MDDYTREAGLLYEQLMMRAYHLRISDPVLGADRRWFYLLYHISRGVDLRGTGYMAQFLAVKNHVIEAIRMMQQQELHLHEHIGLNRVLHELDLVYNEEGLKVAITRTLKITGRLGTIEEAESFR